MTVGQFWLLLIILVLILGFLTLPWLADRRRRQPESGSSASYLAAIDALIRGQRHQAMEALRAVARQETDNWLAYLRLGDLVRAMGYPDRAERIHRGLLARPADDPRAAVEIRESLVEDFLAQEKWEEVIRQGEALQELDKKNLVALRGLTTAHRARRSWERACASIDEWHRQDPRHAHPAPAELRSEAARALIREGRAKEARKLLEEAVKANGKAQGEAQILLGDVLAGEGDHAKAVEQWLELLQRDPEMADQIIERLERSYFELGRFGDLLQVYERLRERFPHSVAVTVALADMHRRRGRAEEAASLLESLLAAHPEHVRARRLLVSCLLQMRRMESAVREMDVLLKNRPQEDAPAEVPAQPASDW